MRITLGVAGALVGMVLGALVARALLLDGLEQVGLAMALEMRDRIDWGKFLASSVVLRVLAGAVLGACVGAWGGLAIARRRRVGQPAPAPSA